MAKRVISWTLEGKVLKMSKYDKEAVVPEVLGTYDISKLFPEDLNEVQMYIVTYGLKQKLADVGSAEKLAEDKAKVANELWEDLKAGKISRPRANGTGAAAAKKVAKKVSEVISTVSLEGLTLKKMMFPDTFTEEDQAKLDEFIRLQSQHLEKQAEVAEEKAVNLGTELKIARKQVKAAKAKAAKAKAKAKTKN